MAASSSDYILKATRRFSTTVGASGVADGSVTTIPLTSVVGLATDTGIEITIDRVDASGNLTSSNEEVVRGVVSGSNLTSCVRGVEGSAQAHAAGKVVEQRLTADQWNRLATHILTQHNQDGTHKVSTNYDSNGNETQKWVGVSSAVNEITATNATTGNGPIISATGGDTNVDLNLQPKGTGALNVKGTSTSSAEVRLFEDTDNGSNYIGFKAPSAVTANKTFTLPDGDGTSGQTMVTNGSGVLSWSTPTGSAGVQRVRVYRSADQTISNATETAMQWNNESFDTDTMHDNVTNNTRITFTTAGVYAVGGMVGWNGNSTGKRYVYIKLNNTTTLVYFENNSLGGAQTTPLGVSTIYSFSASDYIEFIVYQNSGGSLATYVDSLTPSNFWAFRIG